MPYDTRIGCDVIKTIRKINLTLRKNHINNKSVFNFCTVFSFFSFPVIISSHMISNSHIMRVVTLSVTRDVQGELKYIYKVIESH